VTEGRERGEPFSRTRFTAGLTIARANPRDYGAEIPQLFFTHERPEFPNASERAY
jgi:hypothetical protein